MSGGIPARVRASVAIARGETYAGSVAVKQLSRLRPLLLRDDGSLEISLRLRRDEHGMARLDGSLSGSVWLECQRGLHPFANRLDVLFSLLLVASEAEERRVQRVGEALVVEDDNLPLRQIIEDEVLLALPVAPRCENPACAEHAADAAAGPVR
jgi:uncharacterized protein